MISVFVCINVEIGQSDTCENELKVNSKRQARDLQGLWNNSSRCVMYLSQCYSIIFILVYGVI